MGIDLVITLEIVDHEEYAHYMSYIEIYGGYGEILQV
jgi:hypothetical protein